MPQVLKFALLDVLSSKLLSCWTTLIVLNRQRTHNHRKFTSGARVENWSSQTGSGTMLTNTILLCLRLI